ncbi:MAG: Uma2 family endonuclease [Gammaproteobacteria bacterium]|nr:Uma2 family endonuclease [Gammaproteobacteria bacterium]
MTPPRRDALHHTYADYLTWTDDGRAELIDGIAYVKEPPAPSRSHQEIVGELYFQVRLALAGKPWRTYIAPFDVRLPKSGEADDRVDTVVQPDILVVCDLDKLDDRGMRSAPDWIAEVLSPSTASYDRTIKVPVYERAGVRELWLVHPADRTLTIYRLEEGRYGRPTILELKGRTEISAIPGASIDWDRLSG